MKIRFIISVLLFSFCLLIFSCKKQNIPFIPAGVNAVINDTSWSGQHNSAIIDTIGAYQFLTLVFIDSFPLSEIYLHVPYFNGKTSTYNISDSTSAALYYYGYTQRDDATSGTITISQVSANNIQGVFSFVSGSVLAVTKGTFNIPLK